MEKRRITYLVLVTCLAHFDVLHGNQPAADIRGERLG